MSLTEGKNILVYVETAGDTPVGPALEILAKAKELAGAKGEKVIAAVLAKEPDAAARTAIEAGADEAVIVKTEEKRPEVRAACWQNWWRNIHRRWCWQQRPRRAKMLLRWLHRNSMQDVPLMS